MKAEAAVPVCIQDGFCEVIGTVSLDDLVATGDSYQIYLMNAGRVGSNEYELIVQAEGQLAEKLRLGRLKRRGGEQ